MSFQDELNRVSRTKEDAEASKNNKEYRLGAKCGESDYQIIKKELSAMANNGDYESYNGRRHINFYYETDFARWDFKLNISSVFVNKTPFNPGGSRADQASYMLINKPHFDGYIDTLQELAKADNIMIQAVGYYKNRSKNIQVFPLIGGSITGFLLLECDFSVRIRCSVEF